ncbi:unnamed protein product [Rhodiola kirilowii]
MNMRRSSRMKQNKGHGDADDRDPHSAVIIDLSDEQNDQLVNMSSSVQRKQNRGDPPHSAVTIDQSDEQSILKGVVLPNGLDIVLKGYSSISYCEASKHRSCYLHILARKLAKGKKWRNEDNIELELFERSSPCYRKDVPGRDRSKRSHKCQVATRPKGKLDSTTFHAYFRSLWDKFPKDKKASFAYLDCLWFRIYYDPTSRQKVLSWIKKETIFSKKYVIVPIVLWDHWNLLILCNFDENLESSTRRPCMLLLDSLENAGSKRYEPVIRKFLVDVFKALGRPETRKLLNEIPCMVPKVPQQTNDIECGNFVLYFIYLFVNASPEAFDVSNCHTNFMNEKWFDRESYEHFCNDQLSIAS